MDAPIAQLDRASDYESAGRPFESGWARQQNIGGHITFLFVYSTYP